MIFFIFYLLKPELILVIHIITWNFDLLLGCTAAPNIPISFAIPNFAYNMALPLIINRCNQSEALTLYNFDVCFDDIENKIFNRICNYFIRPQTSIITYMNECQLLLYFKISWMFLKIETHEEILKHIFQGGGGTFMIFPNPRHLWTHVMIQMKNVSWNISKEDSWK